VADEELVRSVKAWRAQRYAALRRPRSWLTLAGLDWLAEGSNRIGTDPGSAVRLGRGPAHAGTIALRDGSVTATSGPDGGLRHAGEPVRGLPVVADSDSTDEVPPTLLEVEAYQMNVIRRGAHRERFGVRTWDTTTPAAAAFEGIPHWPIDPRWAVRAAFERAVVPRTVRVPDVLGDILDEASPGVVRFTHDGTEHELDALEGGEDGELWLIFGDATNGRETYGGGRFLYTPPPGADGSVLVDFNRAYNPPCVFSPYATCPLPPSRNRLGLRIEAGEQEWHG
jgi:uncharacterized protein (DUF1684 family)